MKFIKEQWAFLVVILLVTVAIGFRLKVYGNLRLSMTNNDTPGYISSSEVNLLSWGAFTGRRLFTTNAVYQVLRPQSGYQILVNGSINTTIRRIQKSFVDIVFLQITLSALGWGLLALAFTSQIKNAILKILAALLILGFAFVPQIVDWDSLLTSESLTFSLFAFQFTLLIVLAFRLSKIPSLNWRTGLLLLTWLITVFFWTFLRDTNLYGLLIDLVSILSLFIFQQFRKQLYILGGAVVLIGILILGWVSSGQSQRSLIALNEVYQVVVLPNPAVSSFMHSLGMPDPNSPQYATWFAKNAKSAYLKFLIAHPGYITTIYYRDTLKAFADGMQPYFNTPEAPIRISLIPTGMAFHPDNPSPVFLDLILLAGLWILALKKRLPQAGPWVWLATWVFLFASMNMFVVIFGDSYGLTRHALLATTVFRLFTWVFTITIIDLALLPNKEAE